ncbi:MAG: hypothetical protein ABI145_15385 [Steroidobacteraceae bacterium]
MDIQVSGFLVKKSEIGEQDFVVFGRMNLDVKGGTPEFYVLPVSGIRRKIEDGVMPKITLNKIRNCEQYREAWHMIVDRLR